MAHPSIEELVPSASITAEVERALRAAPLAPVVDAVVDSRQPWWRRRACARALAGRVEARDAERLLAVAADAEASAEVRTAVIDVLAVPHQPWSARLLDTLREVPDERYGPTTAVYTGRAALEDVTVAPHLTVLAASEWSGQRAAGERGLDRLLEGVGLDAVLVALGAHSLGALAFEATLPSHRLLGVRLLHRAGQPFTRALLDASTQVAQLAAELLGAVEADEALDDELLGLVHEHHSLWALLVFHRRGRDIRALWDGLGRPRVELGGLPEDVRHAIMREYLPGERGTDPRWLVEQACTALPEPPDVEALLARASRALSQFDPLPPISAGEYHQQGGGSYFIIDSKAGQIAVSTLGPYVSLTRGGQAARKDLERAGFHVIEGALAGLSVEGLCVYFFGDRAPLTVLDLLFYWQD